MADGSSGDSVTEVTTTGWGARIGQSFVAMLLGVIIVPVTVGVLYWNEGRAIIAAQALDRGASELVEAPAATVDPALEGKLVHVAGAFRMLRRPRAPHAATATG